MSVTGGFSINTNHLGDFDRGDFTIREDLTSAARTARTAFRRRSGSPLQPHHQHVPHGRKLHVQRPACRATGWRTSCWGARRPSSRAAASSKISRARAGASSRQDNWRVNPDLTLNLGVRWDPYLPYYDREGRVVCFQPGAKSQRYPNAPAGLLYGGDDHDPGCPVGGSDPNVWNIAPRIGFAYRLTEDGRTSLRGGYGHFYTPIQASAFNPFTNIAPFAPGFSFDGVSFEDPFGSAGVPNPFPEQYGPRVPGAEATFVTPTELRAVFAKDFRTPLLAAWNLSLERQIGADWVFRVAYIGNKGSTSLPPRRTAVRSTRRSTCRALRRWQTRRPGGSYQDYSRIGLYESTNTTKYNSLQLNAEKRFGKGLSMLASYTFSRKMDDYGWTTPDDRRFDYGLSREDVPHNFKFSNVWQIPQHRSRPESWANSSTAGW